MQLRQLSATNFRNLISVELAFAAPTVAFVGENGEGKTNVLEAILLLALAKSVRAEKDEQLIRRGETCFRVVGVTDDRRCDVAAVAEPRFTKQLKVNDRIVAASEFVGQLPIVAFFPDDLNVLLLSPSLRRRYLDIVLCQTDPSYVVARSAYDRALRQRNALLVRISEHRASIDELDFWDDELARHGVVIGQARATFIAAATPVAAMRFSEIASDMRTLRLSLKGFCGEELTADAFVANLRKLRTEELRYAQTMYGPHRQDLLVTLDDVAIAADGSRGEIRSAVLALKFAELAFLESAKHTKPILLLDDVFSELDRGRQERLMNLFADCQTFITTTKREHLDAVNGEKQVFTVEAGVIQPT